MKLSNNGYKFIATQEGVKNTSYPDVKGIYTIGIGFIMINGKAVTKGMSMSDDEIEKEFFVQITKYENCVNANVKSILNQNQFDSLVSFAYNLGCHALESSTMLKMINVNPADKGIEKEFEKWCKAGGLVIKGLLNRRIAESKLYFS